MSRDVLDEDFADSDEIYAKVIVGFGGGGGGTSMRTSVIRASF